MKSNLSWNGNCLLFCWGGSKAKTDCLQCLRKGKFNILPLWGNKSVTEDSVMIRAFVFSFFPLYLLSHTMIKWMINFTSPFVTELSSQYLYKAFPSKTLYPESTSHLLFEHFYFFLIMKMGQSICLFSYINNLQHLNGATPAHKTHAHSLGTSYCIPIPPYFLPAYALLPLFNNDRRLSF